MRGLSLAVFVAGLISGVAPIAFGGNHNRLTFPRGAVADQLLDYRPAPNAGLDPVRATRLIEALTALPGVTRVLQARTPPAELARHFRVHPGRH